MEEDFVTLFAKGATKSQAKPVKQMSTTSAKQECVKLLDSKRSQAIGILMSSQRLDSQLVREALLEFDNQLLNYETLNSIYLMRPQEDELRTILDYTKSGNPDLLDRPELFLVNRIFNLCQIELFNQFDFVSIARTLSHSGIRGTNLLSRLPEQISRIDRERRVSA